MNADIKTFLEDRLRVLDPGIDLNAGSPAQVQFIDPVLKKLGSDPFQTDVDTFITDRFRQEYPDIFAGDPSAVRDLFIKPLITLLEPFKREVQLVRTNQSLQDPTVLSDADAEALVANVFDEREPGHYAKGTVRVYFSNPTNVQVEISTRFYTASGLNFFPPYPVAMSAEEMVFNPSGTLYYMDVPVRAEKEGSEYNVAANVVVGVSGIFGSVKVTNPRKLQDGSSKIDTPTFVAQAREALTERSLVTRRGANARTKKVFQGELKAIQVIGAGDVEMQRDLLVGSSPGHAWMTGKVTLYDKMALVQCRTVDASPVDTPTPGDTLYLYRDQFSYSARWGSLDQSLRVVRLKVEEVFGPPIGPGNGFQVSFLVRWSDPTGQIGLEDGMPFTVEGGFVKKGTLQISSIPSVGAVALSVPNQEVHVYGHTDIYARPSVQGTTTAVLSSLVDEAPVLQRTSLRTTAGSNLVSDVDANVYLDFTNTKVSAGDLLVIETGDDAGTYVIGAVTPNTMGAGSSLVLRVALNRTEDNVRYHVTKSATVNPFEPKDRKLPFGNVVAEGLRTTIGTNLYQIEVDALTYGAKVGDILRIKEGLDAGDLTIVGFDATLGGRGILCNKKASSSDSGLTYEIFTALESVARPLVRIKELALLDSSKKSTGTTIPPADPVAVVPTSDFTTARVLGHSELASGFVLPAMRGYVPGTNVAAAHVGGNDYRYSGGMESVGDGTYLAMDFSPVQAEMLVPADCLDSCSYFLALPESTVLPENFPPINPKAGDALTLKDGPNRGSYLIQKVLKFKYPVATGKVAWAYFVKIHGSFPVDTFKQLIDFCDANGAGITKMTGLTSWPSFFQSFFDDPSTGLGVKLSQALGNIQVLSPTPAQLQDAINSSVKTRYEWGEPARGVLRTYFAQPTLFQMATAESADPTVFDFLSKTGEVVSFIADPGHYQEHTTLPPRYVSDVAPKDYPRDLVVSANNVALSMESRPSAFALGIEPGDVLEVHEEVIFYQYRGMAAVQTFKGQQRVVVFGATLTQEMVGNILAIEEGDDFGTYVITSVGGNTLYLDRSLTYSTPTPLASGAGFMGVNAGVLEVNSPLSVFGPELAGKWISIFGVPSDPGVSYFQASYRISSVQDAINITLDHRGIDLTQFPAGQTAMQFVVTDAPTTSEVPTDYTTGSTLTGVRPIRMYNNIPQQFPIVEVTRSPSISEMMVDGEVEHGHMQPFRIFRKNIRRVTSAEMASSQDGSFYFFDTEVVSLAPGASANIKQNSYLTVREGSFLSLGFRHVVDDYTKSYSTKETGKLVLPARILPPFSADSEDNMLHIVGASVQVTYETADVVSRLQAFVDSVEDRVTSANILARHFLPSFVSYDATYSGGSSPSVIAKDIIDYINSIPVEMPVDVSVVQDFIARRGGNLITPTKVALVTHDWDRKVWAEFSANELGGRETAVPYHGTPRVTHYRPGADTSGQASPAMGERINLSQV